jgi:phage I-like protein
MKMALYCQIGGEAPELIRLLPLGEVVLGDGRQPFLVTPESLEKIMEAWSLRGNDMVIDYEHQTVTGQEAPAAGWVKELTPASDGLWARVVWTDRAKEYLNKREYRYFSPVVQLGEGRVVVDLLHAALTNFPAITNLTPLILQHQDSEESELTAGLWEGGTWEEEKEIRREEESTTNRGGKMIFDELRRIFGLQDDASEAQILAMANDLVKIKEQKRQDLPLEIISSLGLAEEDSMAKAVDRIESFKAEVQEAANLREEITALKEEQSVQIAERLIQEALGSRRTTPAELDLANGRLRRLAQDDPDFFRELILSRQENWAVPGPLGGDNRIFPDLSREERTICETFGITPEAFMKNRGSLEKGE